MKTHYLFDFDGVPVDSMHVWAGMQTVGVYDASSADFADRMKAVADRYITDFSEM
ncbi:MAG: hypothetical protein KBS41_03970 [Oscillospiraceae bacterium]|nr:hypothetical protein [Candidatus Equicaccousia limihippi]